MAAGGLVPGAKTRTHPEQRSASGADPAPRASDARPQRAGSDKSGLAVDAVRANRSAVGTPPANRDNYREVRKSVAISPPLARQKVPNIRYLPTSLPTRWNRALSRNREQRATIWERSKAETDAVTLLVDGAVGIRLPSRFNSPQSNYISSIDNSPLLSYG